MLCSQEYVSSMAKLVFTLRQKCVLKDNQLVHRFGITNSEYMCLVQFLDLDTIGVKQLAKQLEITSGGVTRILTSLEDKGIIKRRISLEDRRNIDVHLTRKGKTMADHIRQESCDLHAEILNHFEPDHQRPLMNAIDQLIKAIDKWLATHEPKADTA